MTRWIRVFLAGTLGLVLSSIARSEDQPPPQPQPTLTEAVDKALAAAATEAAGDPEKARTLVKGRVAAEDYEGVLKGARGAWLTRGANSADQALLVATLLGNGVATRFAWCDDAPAPPPTPFFTALDKPEALTSGQSDAVKEVIGELVRIRTATLAEAAAHKAEIAAPLAAANLHPVQRAPEAARHVWAQLERDGAWLDVDPTTADGTAPCAAAGSASQLPEDMFVRVRLSVDVETKADGKLSAAEALGFESHLADLATARVTFGFAEAINRPDDRTPDADHTVPYTPVLVIDGRQIAGSPFRLRAATAAVGGAIADVGGLFDEPSDQAPPPTDVTAATLVVKLIGPGMPDELRSEIFDRIGPAGRASGAEAAPLQDLVVANADYAALAAIWQIGLLTGSSDPRIIADMDFDPMTNDGLFGQVDMALRAYPGMRRGLGASNAMPIVLLGGLLPSDGDDGMPVTQFLLDALYVPSAAAAQEAVIADGAASLAAESMLAALLEGHEPPLSGPRQVFAAARADSIPLVLVRSEADLSGIGGLSGEATARMTTRLRRGEVLLTPQFVPSVDGAMATAWWTVDPATGAVRDEHENGRHSELGEYEETNCPATSSFSIFRELGMRLVRPIAMLGVVLAMGGDPAGAKVVDIALKIQSADEKTKKAGQMAQMISCAK